MRKVKIYGAGSIGNHLAHACCTMGWEVTMCDTDPAALERTKNDIYPTRYGKWNNLITLYTNNEAPKGDWDLVIIGTPPESHIPLALETLKNENAKSILIEKPLCSPSLEGVDEMFSLAKQGNVGLFVAYNHTTTNNTLFVDQLIEENDFGVCKSMHANILEHWQGIFNAHPWLKGPQDTYLGFYKRGGGAWGEHSHGINIWQHFAHKVGAGRVVEVSAVSDMISKNGALYDQNTFASVRTENDLYGQINEDVVTEPAEKFVKIQFEKGYIKWFVNKEPGKDAVEYHVNGTTSYKEFPKTRPDDFINEITMLDDYLSGKTSCLHIDFERGADTMMVIAAGYKSAVEGKPVKIDYSKGYNQSALS